jgi:uracil-DNA glycosylase
MTPLPHPVTGALFASPVPAGTGWPGDPADAATPVARSAAGVRELAGAAEVTGGLAELSALVSVCSACPRLVAWREQVALAKRRSFAGQPYWGRPVPGWGDDEPALVVLGLAPAAHGGNRTGRIFTGDRSGDWLFAALYRAGLASQPGSEHAGDGQRLLHTRVLAAVRCAPPDNKPTITERDACSPWLLAELSAVAATLRVVVCLGSYAWDAALRSFRELGYGVPRPKPLFGHAVETQLSRAGGEITLLASFHPSQQNTFTGKLTEAMLDAVLVRARALALPG